MKNPIRGIYFRVWPHMFGLNKLHLLIKKTYLTCLDLQCCIRRDQIYCHVCQMYLEVLARSQISNFSMQLHLKTEPSPGFTLLRGVCAVFCCKQVFKHAYGAYDPLVNRDPGQYRQQRLKSNYANQLAGQTINYPTTCYLLPLGSIYKGSTEPAGICGRPPCC